MRIRGSDYLNLKTGARDDRDGHQPAAAAQDMTVRNFTADTQRDYIRGVKTLAAFLGRSPATAELCRNLGDAADQAA